LDNIGLTAFDLVAIAIILISSIMAFARGLMREVFSIVAFIGAAAAAYYGYGHVAPMLSGFINSPTIAAGAAIVILFVVVFIVISILTAVVAKTLHKSGEIGAIDRGAGLVFGALRGVLALALIVLLLNKIMVPERRPDWLVQAKTYPVLNDVATGIESIFPEARDYIRERRNSESGAAPT
jgi:membrane protein required for colicin V production